MKTEFCKIIAVIGCVLPLVASPVAEKMRSVTVPITIEHNRMLVDVEFQRKDGSFRKARVWVDTGNPDFFLSEELARDLGMDLSAAKEKAVNGRSEAPPPTGTRIGRLPLKFEGVKSQVMLAIGSQVPGMHIDANLPSTVLKQYQVVFDYPRLRLTLAEPGGSKPRGVRASRLVHPKTGLVQIDVVIDSETYSFALDNGATYSFVSNDLLARLWAQHPTWPHYSGACGCALKKLTLPRRSRALIFRDSTRLPLTSEQNVHRYRHRAIG